MHLVGSPCLAGQKCPLYGPNLPVSPWMRVIVPCGHWRAPAPGDTNAGGPACVGVSAITVAPSCVANIPTTGLGGTAALTGATPRTAASSSAVADASDASVSATVWSSSSALDARTVMSEPAGDLTVILIGASVCMFLLDSGYCSARTAYIFLVRFHVLIEYNISAHTITA